jgi:hypothetical protein
MNGRVRAILTALLIFVLTGCATPINWQERVGVYTYDQAVMEYGPPIASATLTDHSIVADWMTQRGAIIATPGPAASAFYGPGWRGWGGYYTPTYFPARFLRLHFGPDGKLKTWKEFSK